MENSKVVAITPLGGKNYSTWKVQVKMHLMKDGLLSIVDGSEVVPSSGDDAIRKFNARRDKALATIVLAIQPSLLYLVGDPKDPVVVWKKLQDTYQKKSWTNVLDLKRKLYNMKMQRNDNLQSHLKILTEIFDSLSIVGSPMDEADKVITMLASVSDKYSMVVTALESHDNVPSWESASTKLLHEESKMAKKDNSFTEESSLISKQKKNFKCYECGKSGHLKKNCFVYQKKCRELEKSGKVNNAIAKSQTDNDEVSFFASGFSVSEARNNSWIIDSGASGHMCNNKQQFSNYSVLSSPVTVEVGDGKLLKGIGTGSVVVQLELPNNVTRRCVMQKVLYVPELAYNLVSVSQVTGQGKTTNFSADSCNILNRQNELLAVGRKEGKLYLLNCVSEVTAMCSNNFTKPVSDGMLWHRRFCHLGQNNLRKLVDHNMVIGMECSVKDPFLCENCLDGKIHKLPFAKLDSKKERKPLELIHTDVCGKISPQSIGKNEYFLTFIDDCTRYTWVYAIKNKSDVFDTFVTWKALVEKQYNKVIKILRSDNGGEYTSNEFEHYLQKEGIKHEKTIPKTPQQNGAAERMNRTLVEAVRSMLSDSKLPKFYWAEALSTAVYVRNRSPTIVLGDKTPYEALNYRKPNVKHFKIFGCEAFAHIPADERSKLDPKSKKCIFLGYSNVTKGYRLYDVVAKRTFHSRDVIFNEKSNISSSLEESGTQNSSHVEQQIIIPEVVADDSSEEPELLPSNQPRTQRERRAPNRLGEWVYSCNIVPDPTGVEEALASDDAAEWKKAMDNEMNSLKTNNVWKLVDKPENQKIVSSKWIFKKKLGPDGSVCSYKARLVARGFEQTSNFDETFSPVVRFESIRTVLALAANNDLSVHQMDVSSAFLNGNLKENVFMSQPEGYVANDNLVCKLDKSIYGLKQAPKCWNDSIDNFLKENNFVQCPSDTCIYTKIVLDSISIIAVYVDDLVIASKSIDEIDKIKVLLSSRYKMKDLGAMSYFLGVNVSQGNGKIFIGQSAYTKLLLSKFNLDNAKPVSTPMDVNSHLEKATDNCELFDSEVYQSAVGGLMYLSTKTRPDITYAVNTVAKFCSKPTKVHWTAVKRIMRYLIGTLNLGIMYQRSDSNDCLGFSDADWAGDRTDRKSTSGYCFMIGNAVVSWRSNKQTCVALSTAEAEYVALSSAAQEAIWLKQLTNDLNFGSSDPLIIMEDNQAAICIANNPVNHGKTKHIQIKYHFVREAIQQKVIDVHYCSTDRMLADIFTKALSAAQFVKLRTDMGMKPL